MLAFQRAHAWQELFTLAQSTGTVDEESLKDLAVDVAGAYGLVSWASAPD